MFKTNRKDLENAASNRSSVAKRVQNKVDASHMRIATARKEPGQKIAVKMNREEPPTTNEMHSITRSDTKKKLNKAFKKYRTETTK